MGSCLTTQFQQHQTEFEREKQDDKPNHINSIIPFETFNDNQIKLFIYGYYRHHTYTNHSIQHFIGDLIICLISEYYDFGAYKQMNCHFDTIGDDMKINNDKKTITMIGSPQYNTGYCAHVFSGERYQTIIAQFKINPSIIFHPIYIGIECINNTQKSSKNGCLPIDNTSEFYAYSSKKGDKISSAHKLGQSFHDAFDGGDTIYMKINFSPDIDHGSLYFAKNDSTKWCDTNYHIPKQKAFRIAVSLYNGSSLSLNSIFTRNVRLNEDVLFNLATFGVSNQLKQLIVSAVTMNLDRNYCQRYEAQFECLNVENDGKLDDKQLKEFLVECGVEKQNAEEKAKQIIKNISGDKYKSISKQDWVHSNVAKLLSRRHYIEKQYKKLDVHQDGVISVNDLLSIFENVSREDMMNIIAEVDVNGDGVIDFEEYREAMEFKPAYC